jgi:hypothetical protein
VNATRKGPRVRGLCPRGHVVETNAAYRRTTWQGPCPGVDGEPCGMSVRCTRIRTEAPPGEPTATQPDETAEPKPSAAPTSIPRVESYVDPGAEPGFADPDAPTGPAHGQTDPAADGGPSGVQDAAGPPGGSAGSGGDDGDHGEGRPDEPAAPAPTADPDPPAEPVRVPDAEFDDGPERWTVPGIYE